MRPRQVLIALVAAATLGGGLLPAQEKAGSTPPRRTIVALGDSITAPRGKLKVYPALLEEDMTARGRQVRVVNAGVGGNTTDQAKARLQTDVLAHRPDAVVVFFGANDAAVDVWKKPPATGPRVGRERYEANLRDLCRELKNRGARPILVTPTPFRWTPALLKLYGRPPYRPDDPDGFNVLLADYAESARKVAREEGVVLADAYAAFHAYGREPGRSIDDLLSDGMHPNAAGQLLLADLLLPLLGETPLKRSGPDVRLQPRATDCTHDAPHEAVLGSGLAKLDDGAIMHVYSAPSSYYSPPGSTYLAYRTTRDGGLALARGRQVTYPCVLEGRPGEFWIGYHDVHTPRGWNAPHVRLLRVSEGDLWPAAHRQSSWTGDRER